MERSDGTVMGIAACTVSISSCEVCGWSLSLGVPTPQLSRNLLEPETFLTKICRVEVISGEAERELDGVDEADMVDMSRRVSSWL